MDVSTALLSLRSRLVGPASWEADEGFKDVLRIINRRGMLAAGTLTVIAVALYLAVNALVLGKQPVWVYPSDPVIAATSMMLWDKLMVLASGLLFLFLYRADADLRWGRFGAAAVVIVLSVASVFDDVSGTGNTVTSAVYPTLFLLVASGTIPFRPLQMLFVAVGTFGVVTVSEIVFPVMLGVSVTGMPVEQVPFMVIAAAMLTGITMLLYGTRYDQYRARAAAQRLTSELERHSHELEEAKARTEEQAARLVEVEHMKDRFFANISHEFRTPLTLIMGPVDDALEGAYGDVHPPLASMLTSVRNSSRRLLGLVNDLLDLSKVDAGAIRLRIEEHDLVSFLKPVVHNFTDVAGRRKIILTCESTEDELPASFDPGALEKVIYNLVSNAIKFAPDGGAVKVSLDALQTRRGRQARVTVKDNGPGITREQVSLIWDRFHRIERDGSSEGTGIGLALVKELVELHGGEVAVKSDVGFGSEFTVDLPLASYPDVRRAADSTYDVAPASDPDEIGSFSYSDDSPEASATAPIVLVVDNDDEIRAYVRRHLKGLYRVREAEDGLQALESIHEERPALIISDVMMPRMDGFELCRKVKGDAEFAEIPVVLLTARADEAGQMEGLHAGADDYIPKPFSSAALVARVENLIEMRRILRVRYMEGVVEPSPIDVPSVDQSFMERVKNTVEEHIGDTHFGVDWLADEVGLSARQLQRRIRGITRLTAAGYIRLMRLKRAAQLFSRQAGNVSEVAYAVGYGDAAYFSRLFKQTFGVLPSEFIEQEALRDREQPDTTPVA
ncbi:MAG: response regulator [Rhodothermales bacterium]|nr:response regulator [Rhodothermales bacterium]